MQLRSWPDRLGEIVSTGIDTSKLTTWGVGGVADIMTTPRNEAELADVVTWFQAERAGFAILAGGSNVLLADGSIELPLISTKALGGVDIERDGDDVIVSCGAGASLKEVFALSLREGWSGLECTAGIPGTVGGAAVGNAGTKDGTVGMCFHSARVLNMAGFFEEVTGSAVEWRYRYSSLADGGVLSRVRLRLTRSTTLDVHETARRAMRERSSQPFAARTAGCVFKNPAGYSAGRLIDEAGCKGFLVGGARVSVKHANFFENRGDASAADILTLVRICRERVQAKFGLELQLEIKMIGFPEEVLDVGQTS